MRERLLNQVFFTGKLGKLLLFLSILMPLNALAQLSAPNCESYIKAGKLSFLLVGNGQTVTSYTVTAKYSVAYVDGEGNQTDVTCPTDANGGWDTVELDARPVTVTAYFEKDGVKSESITIVYYGFASSEVSTPYSYEGTYNAPDIVPALPTGSTVAYYSAGAAAAPVNSINSSTGVITIAGIETSSYSAEVILPQDYNMSNGYYYFNGHGQNGLMIDAFTLAVTKRPLSECTVSLSPESITYDGSNHTPYVEVKDGIYLFNKDADYTVSYPTEITNAGDYTVTVTALDNGRLSGSVEKTLTISPRSIEDATVTLTPTSFDYNGSEQSPSVTVALPSPKGGLEPALDPSNYTVTLTNATNAGTATVTVTGKGNYTGTASATFTINKVAGSISYATASVDKTYGDAAFTNALTKTGDGGVTYSSGNTAVATVDATSGQVTIVGAGSATITATVADGTNYTYATKTASYTLTVASATMTVTATGYDAAYDGQAHGISVAAPEGATMKYGESATDCTLEASPTYTNAGTYTVYYEVTKANYGTVTGSATVTISKAACSISYATASMSKTFGDAAFTNALTKTGDGSVTYSSSNTAVATVDSSTGEVTIKGEGTATITATVADGTNYTYATKTASYTLGVGMATMTVTATGYEGLYDGQPHSIHVTAPEGAKVRYGEGAAIYTSDTSPTFTNAGDYLVFYEVTKENYATVTGSAAVKISKVPVTLFMDVSDKTIKKDEKIRIEYSTSPVGLPIVFSSSDDAVTMISTIKVDSRFAELFVKALYPGEATITATYDGGTNYESISASFTVTVEVEAIQAINDNQNYSFEASDYMNADGSEEPLNGVIINNIFHNLSVGNSTGYDSEEKCLAIGSPTSPENIRGAVEGTARFLMDNDYPSDPAEYDEWLALWSGMAFFVDAPGEGEEGVLTVESKEEGACHIAIQPGVCDLSTFQHSERDKDDVLITPDGVFDLKKWLEDNGYVWIGSADGKDAMPVVIVNVLDGSARTKTIEKGKKSGINVKVYTVTYKVRSTSGIESIGRETKILSEDGWYDLRGQRISQPQKKGLYINNGRKIVIK